MTSSEGMYRRGHHRVVAAAAVMVLIFGLQYFGRSKEPWSESRAAFAADHAVSQDDRTRGDDVGHGIEIPCGGQRTVEVSVRASARRQSIDVIMLGPEDLSMPTQAQVVAYCMSAKQALGIATQKEARDKALRDCRNQLNEVIATVRCTPNFAAGPGLVEGCNGQPIIIRRPVVTVDLKAVPRCDWSESMAEHVHYLVRKITWKSRLSGGGGSGGCKDVKMRRIRVTCVANVYEVEATGSVTLACPAADRRYLIAASETRPSVGDRLLILQTNGLYARKTARP